MPRADALGFYTGMIMMWSGSIATIPEGWYLCNGSNGTPDLRNKFIVGAQEDDSGVAKTNVTGSLTQTGGAATANLQHTHTLNTYSGGGSGSPANGNRVYADGDNLHYQGSDGSTSTCVQKTMDNQGSTTQSILNPYYALAFIMRG